MGILWAHTGAKGCIGLKVLSRGQRMHIVPLRTSLLTQ